MICLPVSHSIRRKPSVFMNVHDVEHCILNGIFMSLSKHVLSLLCIELSKQNYRKILRELLKHMS